MPTVVYCWCGGESNPYWSPKVFLWKYCIYFIVLLLYSLMSDLHLRPFEVINCVIQYWKPKCNLYSVWWNVWFELYKVGNVEQGSRHRPTHWGARPKNKTKMIQYAPSIFLQAHPPTNFFLCPLCCGVMFYLNILKSFPDQNVFLFSWKTPIGF